MDETPNMFNLGRFLIRGWLEWAVRTALVLGFAFTIIIVRVNFFGADLSFTLPEPEVMRGSTSAIEAMKDMRRK